MNNSTPNHNERIMALLGLLTTQKKQKTEAGCPSDEQLAVFIDKKLKGRTREAMLEHLDNCPNCYHHWLETAASHVPSMPYVPWSRKILRKLSEVFRPVVHWHVNSDTWTPAISFASFASITFILICAMTLWPDSLEDRINSSHAIAASLQDHGKFMHLLQDENPWIRNDKIDTFIEISSATRAFQAGLWMEQTLLNQQEKNKKASLPANLRPKDAESWAKTDLANEYAYGRWIRLLRWISVQPGKRPTAAFWEQQQMILKEFHERLAVHKQTIKRLDFLKPFFTELQTHSGRDIPSELRNVLNNIQYRSI